MIWPLDRVSYPGLALIGEICQDFDDVAEMQETQRKAKGAFHP